MLATGNYHIGSDMDITLFGNELTVNNALYPIMEQIDELYLPYTFDIFIFDYIDNNDLKEHINRVGKTFYSRND